MCVNYYYIIEGVGRTPLRLFRYIPKNDGNNRTDFQNPQDQIQFNYLSTNYNETLNNSFPRITYLLHPSDYNHPVIRKSITIGKVKGT